MSAQGVSVCVANHTHIKMARRKSLEKLYFCMGVLVGAAVSSLLAMVLTTYSLKTTYYYYYYNERIYSIPDAKVSEAETQRISHHSLSLSLRYNQVCFITKILLRNQLQSHLRQYSITT